MLTLHAVELTRHSDSPTRPGTLTSPHRYYTQVVFLTLWNWNIYHKSRIKLKPHMLQVIFQQQNPKASYNSITICTCKKMRCEVDCVICANYLLEHSSACATPTGISAVTSPSHFHPCLSAQAQPQPQPQPQALALSPRTERSRLTSPVTSWKWPMHESCK